jgi:hypothetical protein
MMGLCSVPDTSELLQGAVGVAVVVQEHHTRSRQRGARPKNRGQRGCAD